jgi:uncharacterized protein (DUF1499 family)
MEPLAFDGAREEAIARLRSVIESIPRTKIVTVTDDYMHAEFTTRICRFVDDVEFYVDAEAGVIHFRSASRVGYSDFGANRKRMERFRAKFEQGEPP